MSTLATKSTGQWAWLQLPRLLISCSVPASSKAPFTCTSEASVLCVSFRQCQFCPPGVSANPGEAAGAVFGYVGIDGLLSSWVSHGHVLI